MPLTLTLTEGVLAEDRIPDAIRRQTDSMLRWHRPTGNRVMTPNVTANVHLVPRGYSFSGGEPLRTATPEDETSPRGP